MGTDLAAYPDLAYRSPAEGYSRASQWHPVACPQRCALERSSGEIRPTSDGVQLLLPLAGRWNPEEDFRALRSPGHWHGAAHGFNVDQSIRAGKSWNKKASKKSDIKQHRQNTRRSEHENPCHRWKKTCGLWLFLLSAGNVDDCTEAVPLLKLLPDLKDCDILADKAYGTKKKSELICMTSSPAIRSRRK